MKEQSGVKKMQEFGNHSMAAVAFAAGNLKAEERFLINGELHAFVSRITTHCYECGRELKSPRVEYHMEGVTR